MEIKPVNQEILGLGNTEQNRSRIQSAGISQESGGIESNYQAFNSQVSVAANDPVDIEDIRNQLNAGEFDSSEAIRKTAQNILDRGI